MSTSFRLLSLLLVVLLLGPSSASADDEAAPRPHVAPHVMDPVAYSIHHQGHNVLAGEESGKAPRVTIPVLGTARGHTLQTLFGRDFSAFHGIPYAHKPTRFWYADIWNDAPWSGNVEKEYDASYFKEKCSQRSMVADAIVGSEDCLSFSIYSHLKNFTDAAAQKLPVMVFIHGGAYITGEATLYMPSKLLDRDVIVAVIQYRLGTLGFLYSGTADAPGNMGLMDQVTGLKWIKQYISYFGGDPGLVTVFGQSAGGASTSWMQITPLTAADNNDGEALAHRFIPMSGSALEYWTLEHNEEESFIMQVDATGCNTTVPKSEMVQCMTELSTDEVVWASLKVYSEDRLAGGLGFRGQVPVVQSALDADPAADGLERVIVEPPVDSVRAGRFVKAPTMIGSVRDEGSLVLGLLYDDYMVPWNLTDDEAFLTHDVYTVIAKAFGITDVTEGIPNSFRLGFQPEGLLLGDWDEMAGGLVDVGGMLFLKSGLWTLAREIQAYDNSLQVYFYSFEYESKNSLFDWIFYSSVDMPVVGGISHGDDLMYLFNLPSYFNEEERLMVQRMTALFTNFAKYGNPTPPEEEDSWADWTEEWPVFDPSNEWFMLLAHNMSVKQDFTTRWNYNKNGYSSSSKTAPVDYINEEMQPQKSAQDTGASGSGQPGLVAGLVVGVVGLVAVAALIAVVFVKNKKSRQPPIGSRSGNVNIAMVET